jgi:sec-independent protein translocase protein TatB
MFDVSFSELLVIAVVALLVIGPEKLPKVARTVGAFTGRMQRYMAQIKEEVNREMHFEELQKLQQEIKQSVKKAQSSINQQATDIQNAVADTAQITDSPGPSPKPNPRKPSAAAPKRTKAPAKPSE